MAQTKVKRKVKYADGTTETEEWVATGSITEAGGVKTFQGYQGTPAQPATERLCKLYNKVDGVFGTVWQTHEAIP